MLAPIISRVPGEDDALFPARVAAAVGGSLVSVSTGGASAGVLVVDYPDGCRAAVVCQAQGNAVRAWPEAHLSQVRRERCLDRTGRMWFAPDGLVETLPDRDCADHVSASWRAQHTGR